MHLGGDDWSIFLEPSGEEGKKGIEVKLRSRRYAYVSWLRLRALA